jgi:hypothetical protein
MPHHYLLHKLKTHPKHHHVKKHLSHFSKTHPKSHGGALVHAHHHKAIHHVIHHGHHPHESSPHIMASGIHHKKKLHPLKFKI